MYKYKSRNKKGCFVAIHGKTKTKTYESWVSMRQRCLNKNCANYKYYGGRGIKICPHWMKFENFFEDMGERPIGMTLDRIKNNLGYCKSNCKWSTPKQQQNNVGTNHLLTYSGKTQTTKQWSEELDINYRTLIGRLNLGWSIEKALTYPVKIK